MYRSIADFVADWENESGSTMKVLRSLTDKSLEQRVSQDGRSLGFLAWHVVLTLSEMGSKMGLQVTAPAEDSDPPTVAAEIASAYDISSKSILEAVRRSWTDASLNDEINMYGEMWKRGGALSSLIMHQAHHRAQMTVLMRQAGLTVPGIYGPSREEWAHMGMQPLP
ncbi:MAG TPA: DinB family protein [Bacteroidota bacterium]|nr:DinB family protein [Bacteroidota bacterium]